MGSWFSELLLHRAAICRIRASALAAMMCVAVAREHPCRESSPPGNLYGSGMCMHQRASRKHSSAQVLGMDGRAGVALARWEVSLSRSRSRSRSLALSRARARARSLFLSNAFCLILVGACVRVCVCACVGGREGVWGWCVDGCVRAHVTMPCVNVHHFFVFWVDAPTCKNLHMCV